MINSLITEVENDYFIPQMLVHRKSAEFVPDRINELFDELLDEEYQEFSKEMECSIEKIYNEIKSNKMVVDQDRFSNSRSINRAKLQNENMKIEFDTSTQKLISLKQISKSILDEYEIKIQKIEASLSNITKISVRLRNKIQKLQSFCLSERNMYKENLHSQIFELRQALKKTVYQVKNYSNDYQIVQTISKPKLVKLINQYKNENDILSNSIHQILQIFDGNLTENETEVQSQISLYVQQLHSPIVINNKRVRNDSIEKILEKYISRMDNEIQNELIKIQEREMELTQKFESFQMKKSISPRNLRSIYASRQKQKFPIPNSDEFNFRFD